MRSTPVGRWGSYWPGWNAWSDMVSNLWNRNTSSDNALSVMKYIARNNYVMQKTSKIDLAIFRDQYNNLTNYSDNGLLASLGYNYEFISPGLLGLDTATVSNGVLNETGPAYKAIILNDQKTISSEAAETLKTLADNGLPIVIVGEAPSELMYRGDQIKHDYTGADIANIFESMLANHSATVKKVVNYTAVPAALTAIGIMPDASYKNATDILAKHKPSVQVSFIIAVKISSR